MSGVFLLLFCVIFGLGVITLLLTGPSCEPSPDRPLSCALPPVCSVFLLTGPSGEYSPDRAVSALAAGRAPLLSEFVFSPDRLVSANWFCMIQFVSLLRYFFVPCVRVLFRYFSQASIRVSRLYLIGDPTSLGREVQWGF